MWRVIFLFALISHCYNSGKSFRHSVQMRLLRQSKNYLHCNYQFVEKVMKSQTIVILCKEMLPI